jgi:hypothetical protein
MRYIYFTRAVLKKSKAHVKGACAGAQDMFWSHTWQETPGHLAHKRAIGLRQALRQPIRRKRPWLLSMGVGRWLRQRVSDGKDNFCADLIFAPTL